MFALKQQEAYIDAEKPDDYPAYSVEERIADGIIHIAGIAGSILAFAWLWSSTSFERAYGLPSAITIYTTAVIVLFCFSAAYHMTPRPELRPLLRRFDQSAIFFKIAGTYTPLVVLVGTTFSYSILAMVWASAMVGAGFKLLTGDRLDRYTVAIYLGLGWASVLLLWPLYNTLPGSATALIVTGGLLYSIGVIFHQWNGLKYQNAIWHAFVLVASSCHFMAIASALETVPAG